MLQGRNHPIDLADIRGKIANGVLAALSVVAIPALAASLLRIQSIGWQPVMALHIVVACVIWATTIGRKHIGVTSRSFIIVGFIFLLGLGGFLNFALSGIGLPAFVAAVVFASILFGTRGGLLILGLGSTFIAAIGLAYSTQQIGLRFDPEIYNVQFQSWLTVLLAFALLGGGIVAMIVGLNKALLQSVTDLDQNRAELEIQVVQRTRELENEIKERDKAEQSLRLTEERYHGVINSQTELITQFKTDGTFILVNEAYCRYVGKGKEELLGSSLYDVIPENEIPILKEYFASFSPARQHQSIENHVESSDGELRYFEWSNTAFFNDNGGVEEIQSVGRDITDRKVAEQSLVESEQRYRSLVELSPEAMLVIDDNRIVFANSAAEILFEATSSHGLIDKFFSDFIHADYRELAKQRRKERLQQGWIAFEEFEFLKSDGQAFSGEVGGVSVSWEGSKSGLLILRDITERKEVDRLKSEFISMVSHELRTPLTAIMGAVSLVLGGTLGNPPANMSEMLKIAKNNSEKLISLVNDILDFEKLQSDGMEFSFKEVELVELVSDAIELNQAYAEQFGVQFIMNGTAPTASVKADRDRLEQVISNLLSNAAKFSSDGDKVKISVIKNGENVRVEVSDSGPGIDEEYRDKIFDRFSQADSTDKRAVQGTGLGLSISKAIIDRHGGIIDFESNLGGGTTFFFELPIVQLDQIISH